MLANVWSHYIILSLVNYSAFKTCRKYAAVTYSWSLNETGVEK